MTNVEFTLEEVCYLESLPAIAHVTSKRITYAHEFQVYCMYWYMRGLRSYQIFSSVGMPLELIGAKRIERCISRWSGDRKLMDEAAAYALSGEKPHVVGEMPEETGIAFNQARMQKYSAEIIEAQRHIDDLVSQLKMRYGTQLIKDEQIWRQADSGS